MSFLHSVGRALGSSAAYAVHGTHLASTSIALGAKAGYGDTSERLRERRAELLANAATVQRKLAVEPVAEAAPVAVAAAPVAVAAAPVAVAAAPVAVAAA